VLAHISSHSALGRLGALASRCLCPRPRLGLGGLFPLERLDLVRCEEATALPAGSGAGVAMSRLVQVGLRRQPSGLTKRQDVTAGTGTKRKQSSDEERNDHFHLLGMVRPLTFLDLLNRLSSSNLALAVLLLRMR
jgi:hypothetical protein